ncbi:MAG: hypothetical protein SH809_16930 [Rhodothermales bacterium]|nr:hypothetical protein [Rhodothermales bacterium]
MLVAVESSAVWPRGIINTLTKCDPVSIPSTSLWTDAATIAPSRRTKRCNGNPIVGYSKPKAGIRLMFWSGADFDEPGLDVVGKKFKDASVFYNDASEVAAGDVRRWLGKAREIQWDYKHIVKRKGKLERLK